MNGVGETGIRYHCGEFKDDKETRHYEELSLSNV